VPREEVRELLRVCIFSAIWPSWSDSSKSVFSLYTGPAELPCGLLSGRRSRYRFALFSGFPGDLHTLWAGISARISIEPPLDPRNVGEKSRESLGLRSI